MLVAHRFMQKNQTAPSHIHYKQSLFMLGKKDLVGSNTLASKSVQLRLFQNPHLIQRIMQVLSSIDVE
jgi:hypothetical protein